MLFTTFYFSGTGNTRWAVEQFNKIITNKGQQIEIYSIDNHEAKAADFLKNIICKSDFIGFANPIYGADIPPIMKKFIHRIIKILQNEELVSKNTYMINTFGYINAFGPIEAKRLLANTCFNLKAYVNIRLCNNISTPKLNLNIVSRDELNHKKDQARKELLLLSERLLSGRKYITGIGPYLIPGIIIRKKAHKGIIYNYKSLGVNTETCNRCMQCINSCPTNSIKLNGDQFVFSTDCTACMRCYNFCPTFSIQFDGVAANPKVYHRYHGPNM